MGCKVPRNAPKDGTEIIGYRPDQGVFAFRWAEMADLVPRSPWTHEPVFPDDMSPEMQEFAWWWHDRWEWMEGELTPTHWMPMPEGPTP